MTAKAVLDAGVSSSVFPGACACIAFRESQAWSYANASAGHLAPGKRNADAQTVYDLASITKPVVAMTALALDGQRDWSIDEPVAVRVEAAGGTPLGACTWADVFSHRAGLPAWAALYDFSEAATENLDSRTMAVVRHIAQASDAAQVGTALYSDLGYVLAGVALEQACGASLDALVRDTLVARLALGTELLDFGPALHRVDDAWTARCAPTGDSRHRPERQLRGEVHDDNAAFLGGVTGHAGMFGTACGVARFGTGVVDAWHRRSAVLSADALRARLRPQSGGSHRFGWDGYEPGGSAGSRLSDTSFGHLGFTGTSLWCDPERELVVVLLSNRVYFGLDHVDIRAFRPRFHDAVVEAYDGAG